MKPLDDEAKAALVERLRAETCAKYELADDGFVDANFRVDASCCARYLRARDYNLTKAAKMLGATLEWRRSYDVAHLVEKRFPAIAKEAETGKTFVSPDLDVDGRAILVMRNKLENTKNHDGNVLHLVYQMERAVAAASRTRHEKWLLVIDFDGYSMRNAPPLKTSIATLSVMQDHYPERLYKAILVNAPFLFSLAFKAVSPFVDPVTKDKIVFLQTKDCTALAKYAPPSSVEACLGGTSDYVYESEVYLKADKARYEAAQAAATGGGGDEKQEDATAALQGGNATASEDEEDAATPTPADELR